jgi:NAD+ synthase
LPCHSAEADIKDAREIAEKFKIPVKQVDLSKAYDELTGIFGAKKRRIFKKDLALGTVKPRLRMITLYYFANKNDYLVLGTGNKSELTMGYFTKYGDGGADLLPLGSLLKSQVRELAYELGIPEKIIYKAPTAGLWKGQTDEGEMGIMYDDLDTVILGLEKKNIKGINKRLVDKVVAQHKKTEHKRRLPEIFNVK